jgi:undecaprenyl-diphosphatase
MLTIIQALLLGILQGITEWLPISSSGHLAIAQHYMGTGMQVPVAFDIMLHVATLLVILFFFRSDIKDILAAAFVKRDFRSPPGRMFLFIIIGSIPTAAIGFAFRPFFESMFTNMAAVGGAMIITGIILVLSRRGDTEDASKGKLTPIKAFIIGIAQGIATAPGISRSGATIGTALFAGIDRRTAIGYSFLLAAPAIAGAMLFDISNLVASGIGLPEIAAGFLASLVVGYLSLRLLIKLIMQKRFSWFAVYCFIVGLLLIAASIM